MSKLEETTVTMYMDGFFTQAKMFDTPQMQNAKSIQM